MKLFKKLKELELKSKNGIDPKAVAKSLNIKYSTALKLLNLSTKFGYTKNSKKNGKIFFEYK